MGYTLNNLRVLVVDQNEHCQQLLRTILQTVGVRTIDVSDNAVAGFEHYCRHEYELVFMDAEMEPLSGFDFLDLIRTSHQSPNPFVSVIMLSAYCNEKRVLNARDRGVTEFVAKPFTVENFLKHLECVIENPRSFVRTPTFFGPDRRRRSDTNYFGKERRTSTPTKLALSRQDITSHQRAALAKNTRDIDELVLSESAAS